MKTFDSKTLEKESLGGAEASVIRVAEGLGALGLKVAVIEAEGAPFKTKKGKACTYIHGDAIDSRTTCDHFVQVRNIVFTNAFPSARKYVWMHDFGSAKLADWEDDLIKYKIKMVGVSRWHVKNLKKYFKKYNDITYIHNPVSEKVFRRSSSPSRYDKNLLVWMSSPDKGLDKALELFKRIRTLRPSMKFKIFNPGYWPADQERLARAQGVYYLGPKPSMSMWKVVKKALCVFYPVQYDETFGLVAAEANALGTPLATYARAALPEVVSSKNQLLKKEDEKGIIKRVIHWHDHGRPVVSGKSQFKIKIIAAHWLQLFKG